MAKQLDFVKILIEGVEGGPSVAHVVYRVYEDSDATLTKTVHFDIEAPDFNATVDDFFDGYVAFIKANEGIS